MIPTLKITWKRSRRRKLPINFEVAILPHMDYDCWWSIYKIAIEFDGQLAPSNKPPKDGSLRAFVFLRFPSEGSAAMAEAAIKTLLRQTTLIVH
jgi:hypothetical protein